MIFLPQRLDAPKIPLSKTHPVGRIAQLVEQLTLNQRVQGSSPCAPTNLFNRLGGSKIGE